jgi:hypothetical protein
MALKYDTGSLAGDLAKSGQLTQSSPISAPAPAPTPQAPPAPSVTPPSTSGLNIPSTVSSDILKSNVTNFDLQKTLLDNQKLRDDFMKVMEPSKDLMDARTQNTSAYNKLQNFDVSLEGGIKNILNKPIALEFQQGQQSAMTRDAAFTRSSLAREYEATGLNLKNLQDQRNELMQNYQILLQYGQQDVQTAFKLEEIKRQDQQIQREQEQAAKQFALEQQVTQPFYEVGGTIYRASDGKAYSTPEQAWSDGVAKNFTNVQRNLMTPNDRALNFQMSQANRPEYGVIGQDEMGNSVYGFINRSTGTVTQVNLGAIDSQYQDGTKGGQCGEFTKNLTALPTPNGRTGNEWAEKKQFVIDAVNNGYGQTEADVVSGNVQPGDVLYYDTSIGTRYGHVEVVTAINGRQVTVKGSNLDGKETIYTRTLNLDQMPASFYGSIRGTLKERFGQEGAPQVNPQVEAYARQYASTGKIPSGLPKDITFAQVQAYARSMPKENGTIVDRATGVRPDGAEGKLEAYANLASTIDLAKQLKELDEQRRKGIVAGTFGKVFGSDDQARYIQLRSQIVDLISRARSGAALTVQEEKRYNEMLPGRFAEPFFMGTDSQVSIDNFINTLSSDLDNKTKAQGWAVYGFSSVNAGGQNFKVGEVIEANGQRGIVLPDGTISTL